MDELKITISLLPLARYSHPIYIKKISADVNAADVLAATGDDIDGASSVSLILNGDTLAIVPGA
jgi:hypothetical protein